MSRSRPNSSARPPRAATVAATPAPCPGTTRGRAERRSRGEDPAAYPRGRGRRRIRRPRPGHRSRGRGLALAAEASTRSRTGSPGPDGPVTAGPCGSAPRRPPGRCRSRRRGVPRGDPAAGAPAAAGGQRAHRGRRQDQAALLIEAVHAGWYTGERELAQSVARLEALGCGDRWNGCCCARWRPSSGGPLTRPIRRGFAEASWPRRERAGPGADQRARADPRPGPRDAADQQRPRPGPARHRADRAAALGAVLLRVRAGLQRPPRASAADRRGGAAAGPRHRPAAVGRCPRRAARPAGRGQR